MCYSLGTWVGARREEGAIPQKTFWTDQIAAPAYKMGSVQGIHTGTPRRQLEVGVVSSMSEG